jgi:hypothetical protein
MHSHGESLCLSPSGAPQFNLGDQLSTTENALTTLLLAMFNPELSYLVPYASSSLFLPPFPLGANSKRFTVFEFVRYS